jgi:hypothetical protein
VVVVHPKHLEVGSYPFQGNPVGTSAAWACCGKDHRRGPVVGRCAGAVVGVREGVEVVPRRVAFVRGRGVVGVGGSVSVVVGSRCDARVGVVDRVGTMGRRRILVGVGDEFGVGLRCVLVELALGAFLVRVLASVVVLDGLQSCSVEVAFSVELVPSFAVRVPLSSDS